MQKTQRKTIQGILNELNQTVQHMLQQAALKENANYFKSRLTFKAILEIVSMIVKKELGVMKNTGMNFDRFKESLNEQT